MKEDDILAPKNKFTKNEMVAAAVNVVRRSGIESLTAKALAAELKISTQPVFTCFANMDSLKNEVYKAAEKIYEERVLRGLKEKTPFLGFGKQYIGFAKEEPELYRLLFLTPGTVKSGAFFMAERSKELVKQSLIEIYRLSETEAEMYFRYMWLAVHGIATLFVTGVCDYSDEEISKILTGFSVSICKSIKEIPGFAEGSFDKDKVFRNII